MCPEPDVAVGSADVVGMVIGDPTIVNRYPLVRRRDRCDRIQLAIVAAKKIAGLQLIDRRPAFARHPEGVLRGRADLLSDQTMEWARWHIAEEARGHVPEMKPTTQRTSRCVSLRR